MCTARAAKRSPAWRDTTRHLITVRDRRLCRAANNNMPWDRVTRIVLGIGQASAAIASLSGLLAISLLMRA
jgi:hypothetical protein